MVKVVYYSPSIPDVESTARYAHAAAFPDNLDSCTLITENPLPEEFNRRYDDVHVLEDGTIRNARAAASTVTDIATAAGETIYVTTFHYAPVLSGVFSDLPWVVDVYDDPMQYALNNPRSHHQITARVLSRLIDRATGVVHDYHPHAGRVMGEDPRFAPEGYPVDLIDPTFEPPDGRLQCVWAGSPRLDRGMDILIDSLRGVEGAIHVSVFGDVAEEVTSLAEQRGVADHVTFYGQTPHDEVCLQISNAHVGLCVLPNRPDWYHSTPLKVREYMAGGTVPVVSNFPGMRLTAQQAAMYTSPTPTTLAETLDRLIEIGRSSPDLFIEKMEKGRTRAEMQSLDRASEWFVKQCVSSGLGIDMF